MSPIFLDSQFFFFSFFQFLNFFSSEIMSSSLRNEFNSSRFKSHFAYSCRNFFDFQSRKSGNILSYKVSQIYHKAFTICFRLLVAQPFAPSYFFSIFRQDSFSWDRRCIFLILWFFISNSSCFALSFISPTSFLRLVRDQEICLVWV